MNEQILINYTKTDNSFYLSIINNGTPVCFTEETSQAIAIIEQIKNIIE